MNRFLLALLALLGLATQTAPVEARACGVGNAAVGSCLAGAAVAIRGEVRAEVRTIPAGSVSFDPVRVIQSVSLAENLVIPTVYIGSDRARE